ncbi:MAG: hypothetical protein K2N87_08535 [Eubacterium sp.]|nr:hypothetical protein [Eubacterium sp.]
MFAKKILSAALTAAMLLSGAHAKILPQATVYAKDSVSFYSGLAWYENFDMKTIKISSAKVPAGCSVPVYSKDSSASGTLTSSDTKKAKITTMHQNMGWVAKGLKTGKTSLRYKEGSKTGKLDLEVLPELKLKAVKKSVKVKNGKLSLTVKYQNNTDTDIVIEGVDIGSAQILFEGEKEPSKDDVIPCRWIAKKVTLPAGATKSITVTEQTKQTGKIKEYRYPALYLKYYNSYFSLITSGTAAKGLIDYYNTTSLSEYLK